MSFYRNVVQVEWVSTRRWNGNDSLADIAYEITDGDGIGETTFLVGDQEVSREEAVQMDIRMGGDGTFIVAGLDE